MKTFSGRTAIKSFAVILNPNAKKVNKRTLKKFSKYVDNNNIYITHTIEHCGRSLDEIIEKRYPLVLCGGGDGTVMRIVQLIYYKIEERNNSGGDYKMPRFGILKLGTGNALAGLLNIPGKVKPILKLHKSDRKDLNYRSFNLIESGNRLFHFGGIGIDALALNDYLEIKNRFSKGFLRVLSTSLLGYITAIILKTIPKIVIRGFKLNIRVSNRSDLPVYRVSNAAGIETTSLKKGDTIYEGPVDAALFGTVSDFGYKLKVMPFAFAKRDCFNLRIVNSGILKMIMNLPSLWKGELEDPRIYDYLVKDVIIEIEGEAPLELGGDPEGYSSEISLKISEFTTEMLDFLQFPDK